MYLTDKHFTVKPKLTFVRGTLLFLSTVLFYAAIAAAFALLFDLVAAGTQHHVMVGEIFIASYVLREIIFCLCSPPRYSYLGKGAGRQLLRFIALAIRILIRVLQGTALTAVFAVCFSFRTLPSPEALLAGTVVGFLGISMIQDYEWSATSLPRGSKKQVLVYPAPALRIDEVVIRKYEEVRIRRISDE